MKHFKVGRADCQDRNCEAFDTMHTFPEECCKYPVIYFSDAYSICWTECENGINRCCMHACLFRVVEIYVDGAFNAQKLSESYSVSYMQKSLNNEWKEVIFKAASKCEADCKLEEYLQN